MLQLGQRRPQDLDLPRHGEHNVRLVAVLQKPPHLHGVVLGLLHECLHNCGVVLLVLHEPLHLGAVLQLGQRRPQDLDPRRGEHNVWPVVVLQHPPHLHGEVLGLVPLPGVGLLVLHGVLHVQALLGAELQLGEAQG